MLDDLKQLLRIVLNISDNSYLRGNTKYNQLNRALDAVIRFCSEASPDVDEMKAAEEMIMEFKQQMGSSGWKLKRAVERVQMNL